MIVVRPINPARGWHVRRKAVKTDDAAVCFDAHTQPEPVDRRPWRNPGCAGTLLIALFASEYPSWSLVRADLRLAFHQTDCLDRLRTHLGIGVPLFALAGGSCAASSLAPGSSAHGHARRSPCALS